MNMENKVRGECDVCPFTPICIFYNMANEMMGGMKKIEYEGMEYSMYVEKCKVKEQIAKRLMGVEVIEE